jgi:actin-like ATPase involved in cell morphogenesis
MRPRTGSKALVADYLGHREGGAVAGWVLGIDFGTCFTCAAVSRAGRVDVIQGPDGGRLESAVSIDEDGTLTAGHRAGNLAVAFPERAIRLPKRALANGPVTLVAGREVETAAIVAPVLRAAAEEAITQAGGQAPDRVVLTCPALWGPGERRRLAEAGERAGLGTAATLEAELTTEPVGAACFYASGQDGSPAGPLPAGRRVAVFDFGGGTLDTVVLERTTDGFTVVGRPGGSARLGGEDLDEALRGLIERKVSDADGGAAWAQLWAGTSIPERRQRRHLLADISELKTIVGGGRRQPGYVHVPGHDEPVYVTPAEFDETVRPLIEQAVGELARTLDAAQVKPADLDGIYLAGGSSRVELVGRLIHQRLGIAPRLVGDPKTVVIRGALTDLAHAWKAPAAPVPPEIARAERIARTITSAEYRGPALARVAATLAATDPQRAAAVAAEAGKLADSSRNDYEQVQLLVNLAAATAQAAPDRAAHWTAQAERFITGRDGGAEHWMAASLAMASPTAAERVALSRDGADRDSLLAYIAKAVARNHPDEAERIARSITDIGDMAQTTEEVAVAVAAVDPDRAERIARSFADEYRAEHDSEDGVELLVSVAAALVDTDPGRAEWIIRSVSDDWYDGYGKRVVLLERLAMATRGDSRRSARLARLGVDEALRAYSPENRRSRLIQMIRIAAPHDPARARYLADLAEEESSAAYTADLDRRITGSAVRQVSRLSELAQAIAEADPGRAARLADQADDLAHSITSAMASSSGRADALCGAACALAGTDPWRAVLIADEVAALIGEEPKRMRKHWDDLYRIARAVAAVAPEAAERILQMIGRSDDISIRANERWLTDVAEAMAARDPLRAARLIDPIRGSSGKGLALEKIVRAAASTDLDAAERIALAIPADSGWRDPRGGALRHVLGVTARTDPDRAERLAQTVPVTKDYERDALLGELAAALARTDPDRAERVAGTAENHGARDYALLLVVRQLTEALG